MSQDKTAGPRTQPPGDGWDDAGGDTGALRRSRQHRMIGGVCAGLGRYFDVDPVIFRVVLGLMAATGGLGLLVYGALWLLVPVRGERQNEGQSMLSGQVNGQGLAAVLVALSGCAVFLTTVGRGRSEEFPLMVSAALLGALYWSRRRRRGGDVPGGDGGAAAVADAPPAAEPPPAPGGPSWWKGGGEDGGYLWGPADAAADEDGAPPPKAPRRPPRRPLARGTAPLALAVGGLATGLAWGGPVGTALQVGLACALAVLGAGLCLSSWFGPVHRGTLVLAVLVGGALVVAGALPKSITTDWRTEMWRPAGLAELHREYTLGTGDATLDLGDVDPGGRTVRVTARVSAGGLRVVVPDTVPVVVRASTDAGGIRLPRAEAGSGEVDVLVHDSRSTVVRPTAPAGERGDGVLELELEVNFGYLEVVRDAEDGDGPA